MRAIRRATVADAAGCLDVYAPYVRETTATFETEVPPTVAATRRPRPDDVRPRNRCTSRAATAQVPQKAPNSANVVWYTANASQ